MDPEPGFYASRKAALEAAKVTGADRLEALRVFSAYLSRVDFAEILAIKGNLGKAIKSLSYNYIDRQFYQCLDQSLRSNSVVFIKD